jgi:RNA polymerase sigma-70 factor (ECF subfamily)
MNSTRFTLIASLKEKENSTAWREFDSLYRPMIYRFVHACGVSGAAGEDIVQDCMTAIVRHLPRFQARQERGSFRSWLRRIVVNRVLNLQRGEDREINGKSQALRAALGREPAPDELFDRICDEEQLQFCLGEISSEVEPSTLTAFRMHVLQEQPVNEVCEALGMTANQVHKIKWRVTRRIAERMEALNS